jgi:polyisoprenoid-binding protein YceI
MVTKVRGSFTEFEGKVHLDERSPTQSSAQIVIKVRSIDTGNTDRDGHLRSNDFFDMDESIGEGRHDALAYSSASQSMLRWR